MNIFAKRKQTSAPPSRSSRNTHVFTPASSSSSTVVSPSRKSFNIVVAGPSQAGKSSFIELCSKYADKDYVIDQTKIGNGVQSHTVEVSSVTIKTTLPEYEAFEVWLDEEGNECTTAVGNLPPQVEGDEPLDKDNYEEHLNKLGLRLVGKEGPEEEECTVTFLDTPGLNDTNGPGKDAVHVSNIHKAMQRAGEVHLVIIMVSSQVPITQDQETAIKTYIETFPEFLGILAFVWTNVPYHRLCADDEMRKNEARRTKLNEIIKAAAESVSPESLHREPPHYLLDCYWEKNKQIRNSISFGTIRDVLLLARRNQPVSVKKLQIYKLPSMREVDGLIADRCEQGIKTMQQTINTWNVEESRLLEECLDCDIGIHNLRRDEDSFKAFILTNDIADLYLMDCREADEDWKYFSSAKPKELRFTTEDRFSGVNITKCETVARKGFSFKRESGGEGKNFWSTTLQRRPFQSGSFRINFWAPKNKVFGPQIADQKVKLRATQKDLKILEERKSEHDLIRRAGADKIHNELKAQTELRCLQEIAEEKTVDPDFFRELADAHRRQELLDGDNRLVRLMEFTRTIYEEVILKRASEKEARDKLYRDEGYDDETSSLGTPRHSTSIEDELREEVEDEEAEEDAEEEEAEVEPVDEEVEDEPEVEAVEEEEDKEEDIIAAAMEELELGSFSAEENENELAEEEPVEDEPVEDEVEDHVENEEPEEEEDNAEEEVIVEETVEECVSEEEEDAVAVEEEEEKEEEEAADEEVVEDHEEVLEDEPSVEDEIEPEEKSRPSSVYSGSSARNVYYREEVEE